MADMVRDMRNRFLVAVLLAVPVSLYSPMGRDMLGFDPYYLACEGRVFAVIDAAQADDALAAWRALPSGKGAARAGRITATDKRVILETPLGGERFLEELEDDPLPRIC